jgi:hypothetical protein
MKFILLFSTISYRQFVSNPMVFVWYSHLGVTVAKQGMVQTSGGKFVPFNFRTTSNHHILMPFGSKDFSHCSLS